MKKYFCKYLPVEGEIQVGDYAIINPVDGRLRIGRCVGFQKVEPYSPIFEFYLFHTEKPEIFKNAFSKSRYTLIAKAGEWRTLEEFPDYEICVDGIIKAKKTGKVRIAAPNSHGYYALTFKKDGKACTRKLHRLLGQTFIPNPEELPTINHINHNRRDNSLINYEWSTQQDNVKAAYKIGRGAIGERQGSAVLTNTIVLEIRKDYDTGKYTFQNLADKYKTSTAQVSRIINKQTWKHV